ncbi:hypothetical protein [Ruegeria arenilitoris]|uniref:hypothetical protein n=1 Tax=Ruegeria arenilitoris TaxID=1173585 RepID=UPI0027956FD7|nr:hypothetical protein [Ruegeria arenilitoris]
MTKIILITGATDGIGLLTAKNWPLTVTVFCCTGGTLQSWRQPRWRLEGSRKPTAPICPTYQP